MPAPQAVASLSDSFTGLKAGTEVAARVGAKTAPAQGADAAFAALLLKAGSETLVVLSRAEANTIMID